MILSTTMACVRSGLEAIGPLLAPAIRRKGLPAVLAVILIAVSPLVVAAAACR